MLLSVNFWDETLIFGVWFPYIQRQQDLGGWVTKNEFCFFRNTLMRSVGFTTILDGIAWNFQIDSILAENEIKSSSTFPSRKFQVQSARFRELQHECISKPLFQIGSEVKHQRFEVESFNPSGEKVLSWAEAKVVVPGLKIRSSFA